MSEDLNIALGVRIACQDFRGVMGGRKFVAHKQGSLVARKNAEKSFRKVYSVTNFKCSWRVYLYSIWLGEKD
jgi:hypothetical protein